MKKMLLRFIFTGLIIMMMVVCVCYLIVALNAKGRTFDNIDDIPRNKVALLLGTSPITPSGSRNSSFDNRIKAAVDLYDRGKIEYIIASGGDYTESEKNGCDEPQAILDVLTANGIPAARIILDYDGTRTLNSVVKAKEIYGLDSLTLISQAYHNERAIFLADRYGIHAIGYNAEPASTAFKRIKNLCREFPARVKMFMDLAVGKKPDFHHRNNMWQQNWKKE